MEQYDSVKQDIESISNTSRFLKKNHLRKLEQENDHLTEYSLTMRDEDMEYEWRLQQISIRKTTVFVLWFLIVIYDILWTFTLQEVNLTGRSIKIIIDILLILCWAQVWFVSKVKANIQVMLTLATAEESNFPKWEIVLLKLNQQKEAQRQFFWSQIWLLLFVCHQLSIDFEWMFLPDDSDMTAGEIIERDNLQYFFTAVNMFGIVLVFQVLDIHWFYGGGFLSLFLGV